MFDQPATFVHLMRYARMYRRSQRVYGHVIAPGPNSQTVLFAHGDTATPVSRTDLRYLRWYERLLNR